MTSNSIYKGAFKYYDNDLNDICTSCIIVLSSGS